ncbi:hypothetical protein QJS04_geneDACA018759 [Acorus gramineus]|uniref:Uncharacterized protein n=1 Tax=Acorus gramineus TaxID=55184 RepID=A0AAV9AEN8_ACOGR|nr:hypothetical protein QJS04_geneDACA018759 [Acorus gramineus]
MWAIGGGGGRVLSPASGTVWMLPPTSAMAGPSNQPQIWTFPSAPQIINLSARPVSTIYTAVPGMTFSTAVEIQQPPPSVSVAATSSSSAAAVAAAPNSNTVSVRESSSVEQQRHHHHQQQFQGLGKQELQLMGDPAEHQTQDHEPPSTTSPDD